MRRHDASQQGVESVSDVDGVDALSRCITAATLCLVGRRCAWPVHEGAAPVTARLVDAATVAVPPPRVVLVLGLSAAMRRPFGDAREPRAYKLVNNTLPRLLNVKGVAFGLVIFNTKVRRFAKGLSDDPEHREDLVWLLFAVSPLWFTNYEVGLRKATELLVGDAGAGNGVILLVSAGPSREGDHLAAAQAAWDAGITIVTLSIDAPDDLPLPDMLAVSGPPDHPGHRDYARTAGDPEEAWAEVQAIVAQVRCRLGPLSPAPAMDEALEVLLTDAKGTAVSLARDAHDAAPAFTRDADFVQLNQAACDRLMAGGRVQVRRVALSEGTNGE